MRIKKIKKKKLALGISLILGHHWVLAQFPEIHLADLNGNNGFVINGQTAGDTAGFSVSSAGDVNGDGLSDIIIGAPYADPGVQLNAGRSYVIFGRDSGFGPIFNLANIRSFEGIVINGQAASDNSGNSVSSAGDVNGDGIDDVMIGAPLADPNTISSAGKSYVIFGNDSGLPGVFNLININGLNGFSLNGELVNDTSGRLVRSAGDFNADGVADLLLSAPNFDNYKGRVYVYFGNGNGLPNPFNLSLMNGVNGISINGQFPYDYAGLSLSGAGDINGDGVDDILIGASYADPNGNSYSGSSYVVFGSGNLLTNPLDLSSLNGDNGFVINGENSGDFSARSVSSAGDINGDGIDDLIIGANGADAVNQFNLGSSYVIFGSNAGFTSSFNLSTINGLNGFRINGQESYEGSGWSVSSAGDFNGDGIDDLLIGAPNADPDGRTNAGRSYLLFGKSGAFPNPISLANPNGINGLAFIGDANGDMSGLEVSHAGDVNGDGKDDIIIAAPYADPGGRDNAGRSYVVFGFVDLIFKDGFE